MCDDANHGTCHGQVTTPWDPMRCHGTGPHGMTRGMLTPMARPQLYGTFHGKMGGPSGLSSHGTSHAPFPWYTMRYCVGRVMACPRHFCRPVRQYRSHKSTIGTCHGICHGSSHGTTYGMLGRHIGSPMTRLMDRPMDQPMG